MLGGSRSDPYRMCLRADSVQRSAPLSSMGPADMVPCLELSVTALKCREKSVRKVHTGHIQMCPTGNTSLVSVYEARIRGVARNEPRHDPRLLTSARC